MTDTQPHADRILLGVALAAIAVILYLALLVAPQAAGFRAPLTQRIFYVHVPSAWVAYLAFAVTAVASARHLVNGSPGADRWAAASAEVGLVFAIIALVTGLTWSRVEFLGYTAFQDAKVITLVVVILAYAAYLTLRAGVEEPRRRGRLAAVFGLLGFLTVPLSYLSSRVSVHPDFTREDQGLAPELGMILGTSVIAFTLLYAALARHRVKLIAVEHAVERLRDREVRA
jgi:heme exporter protein C